MSTELTISSTFLSPAIAVESALTIYQAKKDFIGKVLKEGVDFGVIPGTGGKPTLLKPGAEKMASFFGLAPKFLHVERVCDWTGADHGGEPFFFYEERCQLHRGSHDGPVVSEGAGSCNSWEKKYRYRSGVRVCPECDKPTIFRSKADPVKDKPKQRNDPTWKPGYYCWSKKGGCGAQFEFTDSRIPQDTESVPNPDVAEQVNTILKMAQKRALIAAVLIATNVSDFFTQDVEDYIEKAYEPEVQPDEAPKAKPGRPKKRTPDELTTILVERAGLIETVEACDEAMTKISEKDLGDGYFKVQGAIAMRKAELTDRYASDDTDAAEFFDADLNKDREPGQEG